MGKGIEVISEEAIITTAKLVGQYIVDHADELILTEYSDLTKNEIFIRMIRRERPHGSNTPDR